MKFTLAERHRRAERARKMGKANRRHGHAESGKPRSRAYQAWTAMLSRCTNSACKSYKNYGGRGIKVCTRWQKFENFLADMGEPASGTSIDRIDNDGNYKPSNCRWATWREQANNRRGNRRIRFDGKTMTVTQWAITVRLPVNALQHRLREGWPLRRALMQPLQIRKTERQTK